MITLVARCLDNSGCLLFEFIVLGDISHTVHLQLLPCEEPLGDGVEAE
jgi:hypothetical protein